MDAAAYRVESRRRWGASARGWAERAAVVRDAELPSAMWMVDAIDPQPGHRVLELAAGTGDVGFLAAELIRPGGELICSDFAPEMLTIAQERARELGLDDVRFKQIDAESIDLPAASLDGVLCRWGYMLMADPTAALRETRRVLKPGGRVALGAWTDPDANPWSALIGRHLEAIGALAPLGPGDPGQFAWAQDGLIAELLQDAGFVDGIVVETVDMTFVYDSAEHWYATQLGMSGRARGALEAMDAAARDAVRAAIVASAEPYVQADGTAAFPARSWVAAATA